MKNVWLAGGLVFFIWSGIVVHGQNSLPAHPHLDIQPKILYINPQAHPGKVPEARGECRLTSVPATCDLAEQARLFIDNYLINVTVPEMNYLPVNQGKFDDMFPPRLILQSSSYGCALPKYRKSLPLLLRLMSGSRAGLEIDKAWAKDLIESMGPDGLYYIPVSQITGGLPAKGEQPVLAAIRRGACWARCRFIMPSRATKPGTALAGRW